jgi:hypothetical protein
LSEESVKILAKLRASLEMEIEKLEEQIFELKEYIKGLDFFLVKSSIKTADKIKIKEKKKEDVISIRDTSGSALGELLVSENKLVFVPSEEVEINVNAPSFKSFFIPKVLVKYQNEDESLIKNEKLDKENSFKYVIKDKNSIIENIIIENYRSSYRKNNIEKTLKWALEKAVS